MNLASHFVRFSSLVAFTLATVGIPKPAEACGYHDPLLVDRMVGRGMIGWQFPSAQQVRSSIWSAQQAGLLPAAAAPGSDPVTYREVTSALRILGLGLDRSRAEDPIPSTAMVLFDSVLLTRYAPSEHGIKTEIHITNPDSDDLVVVTEEPVILAVENGSLSMENAVSRGMVRLYGSSEQKAAFLAHFGPLGERPLADAGRQAAEGSELSCPSCGCPSCSTLQAGTGITPASRVAQGSGFWAETARLDHWIR